jgi:hypothetical protein
MILMMKLDLRASLIFTKIDAVRADLPSIIQEKEEYLLCYKLNPRQICSIEPVPEQFLMNLAFIGRKTEEGTRGSELVELPQGFYLFAQNRSSKALTQPEWLEMAIEQQKDGLWERNKLGDLLYLRFLVEDGGVVTQVFRALVPDL